jgi:patatin-like phospholipase/acyl hydrolase
MFENNNTKTTNKKTIKVLSIDGGGVRGIIPAIVIADLEKRLPKGKKIAECFDIIAGTSAGGILALMLATPGNDGKPKYCTNYILNEIENFSKNAFQTSFLRSFFSGNGTWHVKYSDKNFKKYLEKYFGNTKLNQVVTEVLVPTYEIEQYKTFFFKSYRAKKEPRYNCLIKDLAYATSAAPTYFPPMHLTDESGRKLTLIDGGISTNNPTAAAVVHALDIYGSNIDLFVVSIGTGTIYGAQRHNIRYEDIKTSGIIGWVKKIIPLTMYAPNAVIDYQVDKIINNGSTKNYFRIQAALDKKHESLDNVTDQNISKMKEYGSNLVLNHTKELENIAKIIS